MLLGLEGMSYAQQMYSELSMHKIKGQAKLDWEQHNTQLKVIFMLKQVVLRINNKE
jgi:hypothetical protein